MPASRPTNHSASLLEGLFSLALLGLFCVIELVLVREAIATGLWSSWLYAGLFSPMLVTYVLSVVRTVQNFKRQFQFSAAAQSHTCPTCGYDLRATPQRCPECGNIP